MLRSVIALLVAFSLLTACSDDDGLLHVDLRTDLVGVVEFDALRVRIETDQGADFVREFIAQPGVDYFEGTRLVSTAFPSGTLFVTVALFRDGSRVVGRRVLVEMGEASRAATVVISRDCRGVMCPVSGNPTFDSCLGGRCVDPRCTPETLDFCVPECTSDDACAGEFAGCANAVCTQGVCLAEADDLRCGSGEYCDGTVGCRPNPVHADAGPYDMGTDSSTDSSDSSIEPTSVPQPFSPENGYMTGSVHASDELPNPPLRPMLRWTGEGGNAFQVQMTRECRIDGFRDCAFSAVDVDEVSDATQFQPETLAVSTTAPVGDRYFWRVRACSSLDVCSDWSEVRYINVGRSIDDYNGDGYGDLAVGAEQDAPEIDEGSVFVYSGSASGLLPINTVRLDNPLDQASGGFGFSLAAAGDLNADGFADLVVGAPFQGNPERAEGNAYVYFGSASGLSETPSIVLDNPTDQPGGAFSASISGGGDINGDGYADLTVGAILQSFPESQEGNAFIFFGSAAGPASEPDLTLDNPIDEASARFGRVSHGGDLNGDGYADIVVTARFQGGESEGGAYIYFGRASGPLAEPSVTLANPGGDEFGFLVARAADFNNDGIMDAAVLDNTGRAFLYYGFVLGPRTTPSRIIDPSSDRAESVALGDFAASGYPSLVVGFPRQNAAGPDVGVVLVHSGGASGPAVAPDTTVPNPDLQEGGAFGHATYAGDFNGDGLADLVVGAPGQDRTPGVSEGVVYVYHGRSGGLEPVATPLFSPDPQMAGRFGVGLPR